MRKALLIVRQQVGIVEPQLVGSQQQFRKIQQATFITDVFVSLIDAFVGDLVQIFSIGDLTGTPTLVFLAINKPSSLTGRPFFSSMSWAFMMRLINRT